MKNSILPAYVYFFIVFISLINNKTIHASALPPTTVSNASIRPYHEKPDTIAKYGKDTVWGKYIVNFVISDTSQVKDFYVCIGSGTDTANLLLQKVNIIRDNSGKKVTNGCYPLALAPYQVPAIIRIKYADISNATTIKYYIEDYSGHFIAVIQPKRQGL